MGAAGVRSRIAIVAVSVAVAALARAAIGDVVHNECLYTAWNPIQSSSRDTNQLLFLAAMAVLFFAALIAGVAAVASLPLARMGVSARRAWLAGSLVGIALYALVVVYVWRGDQPYDERTERYLAVFWSVGWSDPYVCT